MSKPAPTKLPRSNDSIMLALWPKCGRRIGARAGIFPGRHEWAADGGEENYYCRWDLPSSVESPAKPLNSDGLITTEPRVRSRSWIRVGARTLGVFAAALVLLLLTLWAAAALWIEDSHSKLPLDFVDRVVSGPQVRWTMVPENTMKFARFMVTNGMLPAAPTSWRDYFFPEIHGVDGS